jgi:hypothetical protein
MKELIAGAAVAVLTLAFATTAGATICTNECDHTYNQCSAVNGANAQPACMPGWMQCKKACNAPAKPITKVSNVTVKPKH